MNTEKQRGHDAQRIMDDPLFKEALERIETGLIDSMKLVPMADRDTQHELILTMQLLHRFKGIFTEIMQTGKMAQMQEDTMSNRLVRRLKGL
jgi:hypothetical protein